MYAAHSEEVISFFAEMMKSKQINLILLSRFGNHISPADDYDVACSYH